MNSDPLKIMPEACTAKCRKKWPIREVGDFIRFVREKNVDRKITLEQGINIQKRFIAPQRSNSNLASRVIVRRGQFAYCTQLNNENVAIALREGEDCVVSPVYSVFELISSKILPEFLLLCLMRSEFGRYVYWASVGSAYEFLTEESLRRYKIPLPPIEVQREYVDAYKGLTALIEENEELLKSLEATAQACVAECREKWPFVELRSYIRRLDKRNSDNSIKAVKGLSVTKQFREPTSKVDKTKLQNYKIVLQDQFAFVQTTNNEKCLVTCLSKFEYPIVVSSVNEVFEIVDTGKLLPEYLYLQFKRPEFDRYARFNSWGSARETFNWDDMCRVKIPLPPIEVQRAIVALYRCAEEARKIAEEAKVQLALACPAMIQQASRRC